MRTSKTHDTAGRESIQACAMRCSTSSCGRSMRTRGGHDACMHFPHTRFAGNAVKAYQAAGDNPMDLYRARGLARGA